MALSTHLSLLILVLLLLFASSSLSLDDEAFAFNEFLGAAADNVTLDGVARITPNGVLQLTSDDRNTIGQAFFSSPIHLLSHNSTTAFSFSTTFVFDIVPNGTRGGDGFVFTISPSKSFPRTSRYVDDNRNSSSQSHYLAVEFDTVDGLRVFRSVDANHVGVDVGGGSAAASEAAAYYSNNGSKRTGIKLESGQPIQAWIDYDGAAKQLSVTISPLSVPKPRRPLISYSVDISPAMEEYMYVGFSSSTGVLSSFHYILGWSFRMNGAANALNPSHLHVPGDAAGRRSQENRHIALVFGVLATSLVTALLLGAAAAFSVRWYKRERAETLEDWELDCPHRYCYRDLHRATNGFRETELLGSGGFGHVYRGVLPRTEEVVAIKRVSSTSRQGVREFAAEISILGKLRHRHLVRLHGWCRRRDELLLVYELMPNGSLDAFLFKPEKMNGNGGVLSWDQRFKILKEIALGLLYLHEEWEQVVVHRDVKSSNVLLDADMNGRLGDFGLARLCDHGKDPRTTRVAGTVGYMAPELSRYGRATACSDVFAYGVLMLEVACGRRPIFQQMAAVGEEEVLLVDWVRELSAEGRLMEALDPRLGGVYKEEEAEVVLKVGLLCSQALPEARPAMREVTKYLSAQAAGDCHPAGDAAQLAHVLANEETVNLAPMHPCTYPYGVISSGSLQEGGR